MADSLENLINQARLRGVQLTGGAKKELTKAIQQQGKKGKGETITAKEIKKGRELFKKSGGTDYLATLGRTYQSSQLSKDLRKKFENQGFTQADGYYVKPGDITQNVLDKALGAGYSAGDVRDFLAKNFAGNALNEQVSKFMGESDSYSKDPSTGQWSKQDITITQNEDDFPITTVSGGPGKGIYAGIDPDAASGATPAEIDYSIFVDPYKIQAKSAERLGRLSQATDLLGRKMAYGTEYDISKLNRLNALQQAKIQQANYLYNLIPSAF